MGNEPIARGVVIAVGEESRELLGQLAREALSILKALRVDARSGEAVGPDDDLVLLLVTPSSALDALVLPSLVDRAGAAVAIAADAADGRAAVARARKRLRGQGAALGPREMVLAPASFGYLGLESDGLRERLEVLLRGLVNDGERLRLKREGWEEPLE